MSSKYLPTKSNMIKLKDSLESSIQGYELLERKRIILTKEIEKYEENFNSIEKELYGMIDYGKELVKEVNIDIGIDNFINIANGVKIDDYIDIKNVTLMGVEIPSIIHKQEIVERDYGFFNTTNKVDEAMLYFNKIQEKLIDYALLYTTISRLRREVVKVRKRSNALQNIIIPEMERNLKEITEQLEEREREEFSRLKIVKKRIE